MSEKKQEKYIFHSGKVIYEKAIAVNYDHKVNFDKQQDDKKKHLKNNVTGNHICWKPQEKE